VIVFAPAQFGPLYRVSASGGAASPVTSVDPSQRRTSHRSPHFLPDGRRFLYLEVTIITPVGAQTGTIRVGSLDSREARPVLEADSSAAYASGYLLFVRKGTLMAQPFDPGRAATSGEPMPLTDRIQVHPARGVFSASDDGILAYQTRSESPAERLIWRDREGKQLDVPGDPERYVSLELSPDGRSAAVEVADLDAAVADIWLFDLARGVRTRFTSDPAIDRSPVWSPDGTQIVFTSSRKGRFDIYRKASSGVGGEELVFASDAGKYATSWSADGRFLLFDTQEGDIWALPISGDLRPFPVVHTEFVEHDGRFSPDGRWVAYDSNESGDYEVYVTLFPGAGSKTRISRSGGRLPRWRRDGKELYYIARDGKLTATEIRCVGSSIEAGGSRPLFDLMPQQRFIYLYDVSPDGSRFLVNPIEPPRSAPITLVINWTAELKR
jgi:WD40 repeat protein